MYQVFHALLPHRTPGKFAQLSDHYTFSTSISEKVTPISEKEFPFSEKEKSISEKVTFNSEIGKHISENHT